MLGLLTTATALGAVPLEAQCTNLTGSPTPVAVPDLSLKTVMRAAGGGMFGDGNDKWKSPKGQFIASGPFDLTTTHSLHITLRRNGSGGPVMHTINLPPGGFWTSPGPGRFLYNDPSESLGVRRMIIKDIGGFYVFKILVRNESIANAPMTTGDTLHWMLEIESAGTGDCLDTTLTNCTATATAAVCRPF
jgi:hypothetical protein